MTFLECDMRRAQITRPTGFEIYEGGRVLNGFTYATLPRDGRFGLSFVEGLLVETLRTNKKHFNIDTIEFNNGLEVIIEGKFVTARSITFLLIVTLSSIDTFRIKVACYPFDSKFNKQMLVDAFFGYAKTIASIDTNNETNTIIRIEIND